MQIEQDIINSSIKHGDSFECPTCGTPGRLDLDTPTGKKPAFEVSIWWNTHIKCWECTECWLK